MAHSFRGFSKLERSERLAHLVAMGALTQEDAAYLQTTVAPEITDLAEKFVENVIGCFPLPLGVAGYFQIDGEDYAIPMAVEETSIIAAASATAKWIRQSGHITTETIGSSIIGQIQIPEVKDSAKFSQLIELYKKSLIDAANKTIVPGLVTRSGGVQDITLRYLPRSDGKTMAVLHVIMDPCDAMGANSINQVCEFLRNPLQSLTGEQIGLCILSNLADTKLTRVRIEIDNITPEIALGITEASLFAQIDPYRAATNNKGVLNGMDPILIATGNDWRAVEAGVHAYAARHGQYTSITQWTMEHKRLIGTFEAPVIVGTVGGVTRLHPTAQLCLRMLRTTKADHLARIVAAVGLVQNLGALKALSTQGIVQGHMKLHIKNLLLAAGANVEEQKKLQQGLEQHLQLQRKITLSDVQQMLRNLRREYSAA